jgi:glucose/arabinose dehydrogenase
MRATGMRIGLAVVLLCLTTGNASALGVRSGFTATILTGGLNQPTAAAFAPDGRLVVLEKGGTVRLWTAAGGLRADPLLSIATCTDSEMGLLGLAFDPEFPANHFLYLYHTQPPGGDPRRCGEGTVAGRIDRVVRVTLGDDAIDPSSLVVLLTGLRTDGGNHDGGGLAFEPDGELYVGVGDTGVGDGGAPGTSTNPYAHDLQQLEGKILRLGRDGSPAPGNPFAAMGGDAAFVFAYGLRNPFRFSFDPIEPGPHLLWVGDVGQNTWEEIDVVHAGDDLGWPRCEGREPQPACPGASVPPVYVYPHPGNANQSVSVTGGVFYDGAQFDDAYRGDYFFGDYGLDQVYRATPNTSRDGFTGAPEVFSNDPGQPVEFFVGPDGALYWVAIGLGAIVRVTEDGQPGGAIGGCERTVARVTANALARAGRRVAACLASGCTPAPPHVARRKITSACDAAGRSRVCARLGCVPCDGVADVAACAGRAAVTAASALAAPLAGAVRSRCRSATARVGARTGAERLRAMVACADAGATACVPPPSSPVPSAKGLVRPCHAPPPDVCATLACAVCGGPSDLASCLAVSGIDVVDALGGSILGMLP